MVKPSFAMFWAEDVPVWTSEDDTVHVKVWAGSDERRITECGGLLVQAIMWSYSIQPGGSVSIPKANESEVNRTIYLIEEHKNEAKHS